MKFKFMFLTLLCIFPLMASAGGMMGWRTIDQLQQRECKPGKGLEITFKRAHRNPDFCQNQRTIEVPCKMRTYKTVLSMALIAKSAGLKINGFVHQCDRDGQAKLKSIFIK